MTKIAMLKQLQYGRIAEPVSVEMHYAFIGCDTTPFFCINGIINLLKQVLKKSSCLSLIEFSGENMSLIKADIDDFVHLFKLFLMTKLFTNLAL